MYDWCCCKGFNFALLRMVEVNKQARDDIWARDVSVP